MTPASVCVCIAFFPHYVHNCGENDQGTVWNVRGPCCFNNKPQLHVMFMTSSPTTERKTTSQTHLNADTRLETKTCRVKALFCVTWLGNCFVRRVCWVFSLEFAQTTQRKVEIIFWIIRFGFLRNGSEKRNNSSLLFIVKIITMHAVEI